MSISYTAAERDQFRPKSCPACGSRVAIEWFDDTAYGDTEQRWFPGRPHCTSATCDLHEPLVAGFPADYFD